MTDSSAVRKSRSSCKSNVLAFFLCSAASYVVCGDEVVDDVGTMGAAGLDDEAWIVHMSSRLDLNVVPSVLILPRSSLIS